MIDQLSSITSSLSTSIFGASRPFFAMTLFSPLRSTFDYDPVWAFGFEFTNLTIYLCFIWFNLNSFSFSSNINFFLSSSCFNSFLSLSNPLILSFPSFSTSSLCCSSSLISSSNWFIVYSLIYSVVDFLSFTLVYIYFIFSSFAM